MRASYALCKRSCSCCRHTLAWLCVVVVYIRHSSYPLPFIDEVHQPVSYLIRQAQSCDMRIVVGGDFNDSLDAAPYTCLFADWIV